MVKLIAFRLLLGLVSFVLATAVIARVQYQIRSGYEVGWAAVVIILAFCLIGLVVSIISLLVLARKPTGDYKPPA